MLFDILIVFFEYFVWGNNIQCNDFFVFSLGLYITDAGMIHIDDMFFEDKGHRTQIFYT